ncbi:ubl carboxyl-terminal hydrolase 18-like isoform X3 [Chiloscyllium plagiosum]|uniref:ubl carboxyl-terminal hydrolase 18-like isoform X3 n=1 Tax=Chiloscyllium plagiosum TaxID=36176 RepID=UPI001CB7E4F9|nr:ubl carboxyl-terminal hydrolase 18-like isoform X3 [Chiloscyllium plagiosum]
MLTIPLSLYEPSSGKCYKNVMNSLNGFFELQNLDDENKCYCDQCGEKTATQHNIPQYKLISVIVHKDFVSFGHYYVYIKNIEKRKWHCFDDECVTEATWDDVKKTFGSSSSSDQSEFQINGVAYLLFYKRMDQSFQ